MNNVILAIDQGTTSTRAIIFDKNGATKGLGQKELKLHTPANGWVEQDANDIWRDTQEVMRAAIAQAGAKPVAIGITNQRETTIIWDRRTGKPIHNAIVWQDRRTAEYCATLKAHEDMIRAKTGLLPDPYFSATKIKWILDNVPGAKAAAEKGDLAFGTVDSFLLWNLTGGKVHATDITNASRTMIYNIVTQEWDDELLKLFDIPGKLLPEVRDNSGDFGTTADGVPITGMAGDQQAALFGQACFDPGMAKSTYGTGCFVLANIGPEFRASKNRMLTTVASRLDGEISYAIEGAIFTAGAAVQWLRDGLGIIQSSAETEALAKSVPDNGGIYMVPAFTGLGAPHWDPHARGLISGLTRGTTRAHIVRAALEAQAYQTADLLQAVADDAGFSIREIRVDGGMVRNDWVCQFIANITNTPVLRPAVTETTALGAAYLAGLHVGVFSGLDDIRKAWRCERRFDSLMDDGHRRTLLAGWLGAVRRTLSA
jgi:glycerol kinase